MIGADEHNGRIIGKIRQGWDGGGKAFGPELRQLGNQIDCKIHALPIRAIRIGRDTGRQ